MKGGLWWYTCRINNTISKRISSINSIDRQPNFGKLKKGEMRLQVTNQVDFGSGRRCKFDILANFIFKSSHRGGAFDVASSIPQQDWRIQNDLLQNLSKYVGV